MATRDAGPLTRSPTDPPPLSQPSRFGRALALSVGLHAFLAVGLAAWSLTRPTPPVLSPVDVVAVRTPAERPVPSVAESAAAAMRSAVDLPGALEPAADPPDVKPPPAIRWPDIPVRIKPPRIALQLSQGLQAPDAPPPIPPSDPVNLERGFRTAAGPAAPSLRPAQALADNPPPAYPDEARGKGLQGQVLLRVTVSPEGEPRSITLVESSGWAQLDDAAIEAVEGWRFQPALRDGRPEASAIEVPIVFSLTGG